MTLDEAGTVPGMQRNESFFHSGAENGRQPVRRTPPTSPTPPTPRARSDDEFDDEELDDEEQPARPGSIRDIQRQRREAGRTRLGIEALLATANERDDDDEEEGETSQQPHKPAPARVYVVFLGVKWNDPDGVLRESDNIAGVYASEEAARASVASINRVGSEQEDAWYQPYNVEE